MNNIIKELNKLVGYRVFKIGRASNMVWIIFIDELDVANTFSLHISCNWRIRKNGKILIAKMDIYYPSSKIINFDDEFEWDIEGNNMFDEKVKKLLQSKNNLCVKKIVANKIGDLKIYIGNNIYLELYIDSSIEDYEMWRFFKPKESHLVVSTDSIEYN